MMSIKSHPLKLIKPQFIMLYMLASYMLGILFWYQYKNFHLFLLLPLVPLGLLSKNCYTKICISFIAFFLFGNFMASKTTDINKEVIKTICRVYSIPKKYEQYQKCLVKLPIQNRSITLDAYFDKNVDISFFDELLIESEIVSPVLYKNFNNYPNFINNYESEKLLLKVKKADNIVSITFLKWLYNLRVNLKNRLLSYESPNKYIFSELLFGEKYHNNEFRKLFINAGIAHLLSISGLHFAMMLFFSFVIVYFFNLIYPKIVNLMPRHFLVIIVAIPLILFYAFLSGLSIPALRSFLSFLILLFFLLIKKIPSGLSLLTIIAFIFAIFEPTIIFNKSFQMSFLSVLVLILFYNNILKYPLIKRIQKRRFLFYITAIITTSLLISLFLFPITQSFSSQSFLAGLLSNPIAIPMFSFLVLPLLIISILVSTISEKLFLLLIIIPDMGISFIISYLKIIEPVINLLKTNVQFSFQMSLFYLFSLSFAILVKKWIRFAPLAIFALILSLSSAKIQNSPFLTFLDVGQGDAAILHTETGKKIFIDAGGNIYDKNIFTRAYKPFLAMQGIDEIETVIISHFHPDHFSVLEDLLLNYSVKNVYVPYSGRLDKIFSLWKQYDFELKLIKSKHDFKIDNWEFLLLPSFGYKNENDNSLWLLLKKDGQNFLFTGDSEKRSINDKIKLLPKNDLTVVIKVPHHGSKSSFVEELYAKTKPKFAVISVSNRNPWRLPSNEVISYLTKKGIRILRTDLNGQILFQFDNGKTTYKTYQ